MSNFNKHIGRNKRSGGILPNIVIPALRVNLVLKCPAIDTFFKNSDLLPILS